MTDRPAPVLLKNTLMANSGQKYFASLSLSCIMWVDMTAYTLTWRHPDKLMAVETSATSQAFAPFRHPVLPILLKIAPQCILNPHTHLWDFIHGSNHTKPTTTHHRSNETSTSELCTQHRWNAERTEPAHNQTAPIKSNVITDGGFVWSLSAKTRVTTAVR